jgi:translation initiation factor 2 alpha subunit (eIF-2alpha)
MQYFTTGKGAEELNAFRTAIAHADLLDQAATALQNKDTKAYNTVKNTLKTQFGDPEPTNYNVIANAYTREVTKALSAGHIDDAEIKTQGATMPQNASPEQIHGAVQAYKNLMASKAQQRMIQYEQGLQGKPAFPNAPNAASTPKFSQVKPGVMVEQ